MEDEDTEWLAIHNPSILQFPGTVQGA
jgi:hypothetical protein